MSLHTEITSQLSELRKEPHSKLLLSCPPYWIVVRTLASSFRLLIEVSDNNTLPIDKRLHPQQEESLLSLGYKKRRNNHSLGKLAESTNLEETEKIATELVSILKDVFQTMDKPIHTLSRNATHSVSNPKILEMIQQIAKTKDHNQRLLLYQHLVQSQMLTLQLPDSTLIACDSIGNLPTFALFTDEKYALQYDARGQHLVQDYTYHIIKRALSQQAGSMIINPKGDIRGEFYKHELQSIVSPQT